MGSIESTRRKYKEEQKEKILSREPVIRSLEGLSGFIILGISREPLFHKD